MTSTTLRRTAIVRAAAKNLAQLLELAAFPEAAHAFSTARVDPAVNFSCLIKACTLYRPQVTTRWILGGRVPGTVGARASVALEALSLLVLHAVVSPDDLDGLEIIGTVGVRQLGWLGVTPRGTIRAELEALELATSGS